MIPDQQETQTSYDAGMDPDPSSARAIWASGCDHHRLTVVRFRCRFDLAATGPSAAQLHIFAATRYRLCINGQVAAYGPARGCPGTYEYDSVELAAWLRSGVNELVVEVLQVGDATFTHHPGPPGFVAWGAAGAADLATPGSWQCQRSTAWDAESMPISFAQGPIESLDTRLVEMLWHSPVACGAEAAWGPLRARTIPLLMHRETLPELLAGVYELAPEQRFGYRVTGPCSRGGVRRRSAYACCLHAPAAMRVRLALFWGPHLLNGRELACRQVEGLGNRQDAELELHAGVNLLYGEPEVMLDGWCQLFALPPGCGVTVSASADAADPRLLLHSASLTEDVLPLARGAAPETIASLPELAWTTVLRGSALPTIAFEAGWDHVASTCPLPPRGEVLALATGTSAVFDLGTVRLGHVVVELDAPSGTVIEVTMCERRRADGLLDAYGMVWLYNETDRFIAHGGAQRWEGINPRAGRWLQVTVRRADGPVRLRRAAVRETRYPLVESGAFACSDPLLTWLWRTGVATLRACSEDVFLDCPTRERGLYTFDCVVEQQVSRVLSTDQRLARRSLRLYADGQRADGQFQDVVPADKPVTLADFSLLWVLGVHDRVVQQGDTALAAAVWPALRRMLDSPTWLRDADGLIDSDRMAVEHPSATVIDRLPGLNGLINAQWAMALDRAADIALRCGLPGDGLRNRADTAIAAFRRRLWNDDQDCFAAHVVDGRAQGDGLRVSIYAVAFGLASPGQQQRCATLIDRRITALRDGDAMPLGSNESHIVQLACDRLGRSDLALHWIRAGYAREHAAGAPTLWEYFTANASLCHAWSAAPVWWLSDRALGVSWDPAQPRQVRVAPEALDLDWAEGAVPHPDGPIRVAWHRDGSRVSLFAHGPPGVELQIITPGVASSRAQASAAG